MRDLELGRKIKELRIKSGLSQDDLAEHCRLSLRTIQRIENGETTARGDSLKRISRALHINVEELTYSTLGEPSRSILKEDNWILVLLNFSAFGFLIYPTLGLIFPTIVWVIYKNKIANVNERGRQVMKDQLYWCALLFILYLYIFSLKLFHLNLPVPKNDKLLILCIPILYIFNTLVGFIRLLRCITIEKAITKLR